MDRDITLKLNENDLTFNLRALDCYATIVKYNGCEKLLCYPPQSERIMATLLKRYDHKGHNYSSEVPAIAVENNQTFRLLVSIMELL